MKKGTGISKTNYFVIDQDFSDLISDIRNGAAGLQNSPPDIIRKTILFNDLSKMHCQEIIENGKIQHYFYDYYDANGQIIAKFHSEPHLDKAYQTSTEPFHIHVKKDHQDLKAEKRVPNRYHKNLRSILEYIALNKEIQFK